METLTAKHFRFADFELDGAKRLLSKNGETIPLNSKTFDLLAALLERHGEVLSKDELLEKVWPGQFVEEGNLTVQVSTLRKIFGERKDEHRFIVTVPGRGYSFVAELEEETNGEIVLESHRYSQIVVEEIESDYAVASIDAASTPRTASGAEPVGRGSTRLKRRFIFALVGIIIGGAGAFVGFKVIGWNNAMPDAAQPFGKIQMTRLTTTGRTNLASISPDGNYAAYVSAVAGQQSLWLRHIATGSDKEIMPPAEHRFSSVNFSPDGNRIYFSTVESSGYLLYQSPILGGSAKKLLSDIDSKVAISPTGEQIAFLRGDPARSEASLIIAKADGTEEQKLVTHRIADLFLVGPHALGPAWSPDGETIAFGYKDSAAGTPYAAVMSVGLKDGKQKQIASYQWSHIGEICWLRDGSGLVVIAAEQEPASTRQIWYVSNPAGNVRRITNDVNDYLGVSLAADNASLVAVQTEQTSNIWMVPGGDAGRALQVTFNNNDGRGGISWTPNGKIVYASRASGNSDIWIMNSDGTEKEQLTFDAGWNRSPSVSPDGRYIAFASNRTVGFNIWTMDLDGGNQRQLTYERIGGRHQWTMDSEWVMYTCFNLGMPTVCKVTANGGDPVRLTDYHSEFLAASPIDGQIAYTYVDEQANLKRQRVALIPLEGGLTTKIFDISAPYGQAVNWSIEGEALTFIDTRPGVSNIWKQPVDGSGQTQVTDFKSDLIFAFDWSRWNKDFAVARGSRSSDVVLIKDISEQQ